MLAKKPYSCISPETKPRISPPPGVKTRRGGDGMEFGALVASLPSRKGSVYVFDKGKILRHPFAELAKDVARAVDDLRRWGIAQGQRVGLFAPNCYFWLVYDLAVIKLGAISVPFTD